MGNRTGASLTGLLRQAGPFIPARDAYGFSNNPEGFTLEDAAILRNMYQGVVDQVSLLGVDALRTALNSFSFDVPVYGPTGLPAVAIDYVMNQVSGGIRNQLIDAIVASVPGTYGRCGGLAFSAFDFFLAGWPIDKTHHTPPGSGDLRDYIFKTPDRQSTAQCCNLSGLAYGLAGFARDFRRRLGRFGRRRR